MARSKNSPNNPKLTGKFVQRYESMISSPAYRDLSTVARCLLEEFQRIYLPSRNGKLSISTRNAAKRLKVSEPTAINAFYDLEEHGFIVLVNHELWLERKAREWRLTFERTLGGGLATDEWAQWKGSPLSSQRKKSRLKKQGQIC